jgi:hypothetical protein
MASLRPLTLLTLGHELTKVPLAVLNGGDDDDFN